MTKDLLAQAQIAQFKADLAKALPEPKSFRPSAKILPVQSQLTKKMGLTQNAMAKATRPS